MYYGFRMGTSEGANLFPHFTVTDGIPDTTMTHTTLTPSGSTQTGPLNHSSNHSQNNHHHHNSKTIYQPQHSLASLLPNIVANNFQFFLGLGLGSFLLYKAQDLWSSWRNSKGPNEDFIVSNEEFSQFHKKYNSKYGKRNTGDAKKRLKHSKNQTTHVIRLLPGELMVKTLMDSLDENKSYWIISAVGSVKSMIIRMANDKEGMHVYEMQPERTWEVCSFSGSVSKGKMKHIHGTFSDAKGRCIGGHVVEGVVYTTLELCLIENNDLEMVREIDSETGFDELVAEQK